MEITKIRSSQADFPGRLKHLRDPPQQLYYAGSRLSSLLNNPCLAIVGSRAATPYGRQITEQLATECARAGVTIISGLAFGIDSFAHQAALDCGGQTIAVLPSGLSHIYPASHQRLARQIVEQGGALVSEYSADTPPMKHQFIARNRLIAGLSQAVLITEAASGSGSLHTVQFAAELGREVLAVPGNITSPTSQGSNNLLKSQAAGLVNGSADILYALGLDIANARASPRGDNPAEQTILDLIVSGVSGGAELSQQSKLSASLYNQSLSMLEIKGQIQPLGHDNWRLRA